MSRRPEKIIAIIGTILVLLFLGGFSLTIFGMDEATFNEVVVPIFKETIPGMDAQDGFESMRTLAAWFGVTAFLTLVLVSLGNLFVSHNKYPRRAAIFYGASGVIVLLGSQLVAYHFAFLFFVTMGMCLLRKPAEENNEAGI